MPVSFLSEDQRTRYGRYAGELTAEQLARCFHLNDADRELIAVRRGDHNRLGFALQLCTVRFLSTFLEDLQSIPAGVVNNVARQLAIDNPSCHAQYCAGEQRWEHAAELRTRYGYQDFSAGPVQFRLNRWLYALCWTGTDRPSVLFDRATGWLVSQKVLLPGVSVLERFVSRLRGRVEERLWHLLISRLTPQSNARLEALLRAVPGERKSQLERLRTGPTRRSAPELVRARRRLLQGTPDELSAGSSLSADFTQNGSVRASPAGEPLIEAIDYLKTLDGDKKKATAKPPLDIVDAAWRGYVVCDGKVDLQAYTFCFLDRLRKGLRRRDVFVTTSVRYADPRIGLLEGAAWEGTRPFICRSLGLPASANEAFSVLRHELDQTYKAVATNFPNNSAARIEQVDGKDDLILTGLDKLDEPDSLISLRKEVQRRLPRAELPEILLEIAARTGFSNEFTHISERDSRASELVTSICAVLVAQACNTGTGPLERNDVPALRRSRLSWVNQNYIRNETLTAANACLVSAQNRIALVHHWGGGEVASADGLCFVVPVRTVHAGPNPKYFGMGHGVTYYNLVSNQFTGLNGIVVPGTLRDSLG